MEVNHDDVYDITVTNRWKTTTPSSSSSESQLEQIEFNFICKNIIIELYEGQDLPVSGRGRRGSEIRNTVKVNAPQVFESEKIYTTMEGELSGWNLSQSWRKQLIERVLRNTRQMLESVSPGHDVLCVYAEVITVQTLTLPLSDAIDLMTQLSIEEDEPSMVPTTDSSIESLEKKIFLASDINVGNNSESCRVCLEEFSIGCQVACMPCSHVFHDVCIRNWLRTSHYCPICRFEMPKET